MFKRLAFNFAIVLGLAGVVTPVHGQLAARPDAPAFGLTDGIVGCDLTENGLVVSLSASVPSPFNGIATPGEPCLPLMASFPAPFPEPLGFAQLNGGASGETFVFGFEHLVWAAHGPGGLEVVIACAMNEGVLETVLIANGNGGGALGDPCFETLAAFTEQGRDVHGPIAATLGAEGEGRGGGVLWFNAEKGFGFVEMTICDIDPSDGKFKVTYHETSDLGVIDASVGQSCLGIIAEDVEGEALATQTLPIPVPRTGTSTQIPDCLVWVIDNGSVSQ